MRPFLRLCLYFCDHFFLCYLSLPGSFRFHGTKFFRLLRIFHDFVGSFHPRGFRRRACHDCVIEKAKGIVCTYVRTATCKRRRAYGELERENYPVEVKVKVSSRDRGTGAAIGNQWLTSALKETEGEAITQHQNCRTRSWTPWRS